MSNNIKNMVKDKKVSFRYYRDNCLWYSTECGFIFPVPIDDVGTATFTRDDKAILFMRWIRKYYDKIEVEKTLRKNNIKEDASILHTIMDTED